MTLKDLSIVHASYASPTNYYSNEPTEYFSTWADFYEEYHDADPDYVLVYRWDIFEREHSKRPFMHLFMIAQKKGIYKPIIINYLDEKDIPQIEKFLKPHFEMLLSIWEPLSSMFLLHKKQNN